MGWITPIDTHIAGNGFGFIDANRIEGNLKYLREETATFNGAKTFTNNITQTAGVASLKTTLINGAVWDGISALQIGTNGSAIKVGDGSFLSSWMTFRNEDSGAQYGLSNASDLGYALIKAGGSKGFGVAVQTTTAYSSITTAQMNYRITSEGRHIFGLSASDDGYFFQIKGSGSIKGGLSSIDPESGAGAFFDLLRGSSVYGEDTAVDYRMQNDSGFWRLKSNDTNNGEKVLIDVNVSRIVFELPINPTTTPTTGTWTVNTVIPRGIYNVSLDFGTGGSGIVTITQNGNVIMSLNGTSPTNQKGGTICSDGTNTVLQVANTGRVFYTKF